MEYAKRLKDAIQGLGEVDLAYSEEEFKEYVKISNEKWGYGRKKKKPWMVIVLKNIRRYSKVVKPKRFISVGGRYVKDKEYEEILKNVQ
jgi:hypothetical protein